MDILKVFLTPEQCHLIAGHKRPRDQELKPHIELLTPKTDQEQRAWLTGWHQAKRGTLTIRAANQKDL